MSLWEDFKKVMGAPVTEPDAATPVVQPGAVTLAARTELIGGAIATVHFAGGVHGTRALESSSADLASVNCDGCLRGEITRRDTDAAERDRVAKAEAETLRLASIETDATAFMDKHEKKFGKDSAAPFRRRYVAAKTANDTEAIADLEATAANLPDVGPTDRLAKDGPTAAQLAARADPSSHADHFEILSKLAAEGVTAQSPNFATRYEQELNHGAATQ